MTQQRILSWLLAISGGLTVYGLNRHAIFYQKILEPKGWTSFIEIAAAYLVIAVTCFLLSPRRFLPFLALLGLLIAGGVGGVGAVAAVLLFLAASLALGTFLLDADHPALALTAGFSVFVSLLNLTAPLRIHTPVTWLLILLIPILVCRRGLREAIDNAMRGLAEVTAVRGVGYWGMVLLAFPLLVHLLIALKPEVSADGLAMHLTVPAYISHHHYWTYDFKNFIWAVMPLNGDFAFTIAYMLGGEFAARLLNFAAVMIIASLVYSESRRWVPPAAAAVATALFAATPLVHGVTGSLLVENIWTLLVMAAVVATVKYRESGNQRLLIAIGVFAGAAIAAKFGASVFLLPALPFLAVAARAKRARASSVFASLALLAICAAPPFVHAQLRTGNPAQGNIVLFVSFASLSHAV
ncbi:MAG: glycosyltransferase family 39 protein [Candidatus Solibacter usitatus]|nr:glycosyltransferase family 39 protein [Candidatus Solibacter usitatus]